jgi:hypothetical protein
LSQLSLIYAVAEAPARRMMLCASRPHNAGSRCCDKFIYLRLLLAPVGTGSDITKLYFRKHSNLPFRSPVYICMWPQVNAWRYHARRIEAVFRPTPAAAAPAKRRQAPAATP